MTTKPLLAVFIASPGRSSLRDVVVAWKAKADALYDAGYRLKVCVGMDRAKVLDDVPAQQIEFPDSTGHFDVLTGLLAVTNSDYVMFGFDDDPPADPLPLLAVLSSQKGLSWASGAVVRPATETESEVEYDGSVGPHLLYRNTCPLQGCLFQRAVFAHVPLKTPEAVEHYADWDFILRLAANRDIRHIHVKQRVATWIPNPDGYRAHVTRELTEAWQTRRSEIRLASLRT